MAANEFKWLDCDMHMVESPALWRDFGDPKYADWFPRFTGDPAVDHPLKGVNHRWVVGPAPVRVAAQDDPNAPDRVMSRSRYPRIEPYLNAEGHIGPMEQLAAMDVENIEAAVLFPTYGSTGLTTDGVPVDVQFALARAYNDWLADFCRKAPARLKQNAAIPITDIGMAVAEVRRVAQLGVVSVWPISHRLDLMRFDHPDYEPLWAEIEASNLAVDFHGSRNLHFRERYKDNVPLAYVNGRGVEHGVVLSELLFGGVLERHPNLRFVFLEAGASWIIYWIYRMGEIWEKFRRVSPDLDRNVRLEPIDYFRRQCYCAIEVDEWTLPQVIAAVGDDNLVASSDFPHTDSEFPHAHEKLMAIEGVNDASKRKILWDNCAALYGLS
jgi:predicted TIM-barrel fold metal-dependent hydrolase